MAEKRHDTQRHPLGTRIPLAALIQAVAVGEHLNFRHAAAALGVSQSSVSERIRALEETLGVRLFERRHRGVRPATSPLKCESWVMPSFDRIAFTSMSSGM